MFTKVRLVWRGAPPRDDSAYDFRLVGLTREGEFVLTDAHSNTIVWRPTREEEWCEFQCDRCGRFGQQVGFGPGGATCFNSDSDEACAEAAEIHDRLLGADLTTDQLVSRGYDRLEELARLRERARSIGGELRVRSVLTDDGRVSYRYGLTTPGDWHFWRDTLDEIAALVLQRPSDSTSDG
jgi:hypothetical protein